MEEITGGDHHDDDDGNDVDENEYVQINVPFFWIQSKELFSRDEKEQHKRGVKFKWEPKTTWPHCMLVMAMMVWDDDERREWGGLLRIE